MAEKRYICEECRRKYTELWLGPDYGASHRFCDRCLSLLEMGQGLCEDSLFMQDTRLMLREESDSISRSQVANEMRLAAAMYASAAGIESPLRTNWRN